MGSASLFFFAGLALAMVYIYLSVRRGWSPVRRTAAIGTALCAVGMTLVLANNPGADLGRAILYGIPLGALLALATVGVAWYFTQSNHAQSSEPPYLDEPS